MSETPQPYRVHDAAKLRALIVNGQGISPALATDLVDHIAALEAENARLRRNIVAARPYLDAAEADMHRHGLDASDIQRTRNALSHPAQQVAARDLSNRRPS